jgi:hypothetical protein
MMRSQNVSSTHGFWDLGLIYFLVPEHLLRLFPVGRAEERGASNNENSQHPLTDERLVDVIREVHRSLKHQKAFPESACSQSQKTGVSRPGSRYKTYKREEDLPPAAHALYEAAAKVIGASVKTLVATVLQTEWNLQMWAEADRKMAHIATAEARSGIKGHQP